MTLPTLHWIKPWMQLEFPASRQELAEQLTLELGARHPLFSRWKMVIGKRLDNDDIAVQLNNGGFAIVHLLWSDGPHACAEKYPVFRQFTHAAQMQQALHQDGMQFLHSGVKNHTSRSHHRITGSTTDDRTNRWTNHRTSDNFDAFDSGAIASLVGLGFDSDASGSCSDYSSSDGASSDTASSGGSGD